MKNFLALLVAILIIGGLIYLLMQPSLKYTERCEAKGGTVVRGINGYQCVKLEKVEV